MTDWRLRNCETDIKFWEKGGKNVVSADFAADSNSASIVVVFCALVCLGSNHNWLFWTNICCVFHHFRPCKHMREYALAGQKTQQTLLSVLDRPETKCYQLEGERWCFVCAVCLFRRFGWFCKIGDPVKGRRDYRSRRNCDLPVR